MSKTKVKYCPKCKCDTVHKLVGHKSYCEGMGLVRGIFAVTSFGFSEIASATWYYECKKCGHIISN